MRTLCPHYCKCNLHALQEKKRSQLSKCRGPPVIPEEIYPYSHPLIDILPLQKMLGTSGCPVVKNRFANYKMRVRSQRTKVPHATRQQTLTTRNSIGHKERSRMIQRRSGCVPQPRPNTAKQMFPKECLTY